MQYIHNLLTDKRIGLVTAHPDDHLPHGNALEIARGTAIAVHELVLTRGLKSTVNFRTDPYFCCQRATGI